MIGLVSVSFRKNEPSEIIRAARECGLKCIEWGSDIHAPINNKQKLKQIKAECDDNGITCCSYGTYFMIGENTSDELYHYIEAARIFDTGLLRVWCGSKNPDEYTDGEKNIFIEECFKLAKIAEKENVRLCMECHNNSFVSKKESALFLMKTVSSPNFRMYWQPNPFESDEANLEYAKQLADYTEVVHVFNCSGCERYPLSNSVEIWKKYLSNFSREIPKLLEFMPDGRIDSLKEEANTLNQITKA